MFFCDILQIPSGHTDVVECSMYFNRQISMFVFDTLQICSGCIQIFVILLPGIVLHFVCFRV